MSESHMDHAGSPASVLDHAIDRAVRRMVQADPPAHFRRRVEARITAIPAHRSVPLWQYLAVASAVAVLLFIVGVGRRAALPTQGARNDVHLEAEPRPSEAPRVAESHPPTAMQSAALEPTRPSTRRPARRGPNVERIPMPDIQNVFGPAANTVSGASVSGTENVIHARVAESLPESERIAVPLLTFAPLEAGQQSGGSPATQSAAPQPTPSMSDVRRRNVGIEIAITDQTGSGEPLKKVVTLIVAERQTGSVRTSGNAVVARGDPVTPFPERETLNVDATPMIHQDGSVLLSLALEYLPRRGDVENGAGRAQLNQRIAVTLESGKPMIVSRSADPGSSRRISIEVTATVMK